MHRPTSLFSCCALPCARHRAGLPLMLLATAFQMGCLTQSTLDKWHETPLESARLEVVSATNDRVVLGWEATYRGSRERSGELELDPHLPECDEVRVFIDAESDGRLSTNRGELGGDVGPEVIPGPCDVAIVVRRLPGELWLQATNPDDLLAYAHVEAPRNHVWLAVVPLAATADVVIGVLRVLQVASRQPPPELQDGWNKTPSWTRR